MDHILIQLASMAVYFLSMGIFMMIAILTARKRICWLFYTIGAVRHLLSLIMEVEYLHIYDSSTQKIYLMYWVVYIVLLIIFAIIIMRREERLRAKARQEYEATHPRNTEFNLPNSWQCDCGRKNAGYTLTCPCGIKKIEIKSRMSNNQNTPTQNQ